MGVGTARADEFGELRMSHGQDPEQEAPVEDVRFFVDGGAQLVDAPLYFLHKSGITIPFDRAGEQAFEHGQLLAAFVVGVVARHLIGEGVVTRGTRKQKSHRCRRA